MLIFAVTSLWQKYVWLFPLCSCIIEIQMVCYLFYLFAFKGRYTRKILFSHLFYSMGISRNQTAGSWTQGLWSLQWFFFNVMSTQIDFVNFTHKKGVIFYLLFWGLISYETTNNGKSLVQKIHLGRSIQWMVNNTDIL